MTRSKSTVVSTADIRAQFANGTLTPAKDVSTASLFGKDGTRSKPGKIRGRVHPAHVEVFLAANPGTVFGEGEDAPPARTAMLPLLSAKTGKPIKPVEVSVTEAKALAGVKGKRGRLSSDELARAAKAYQA
jgi:hypothetical protein